MPIYYESPISKLSLKAAELAKLDREFEEITEPQSPDSILPSSRIIFHPLKVKNENLALFSVSLSWEEPKKR